MTPGAPMIVRTHLAVGGCMSSTNEGHPVTLPAAPWEAGRPLRRAAPVEAPDDTLPPDQAACLRALRAAGRSVESPEVAAAAGISTARTRAALTALRRAGLAVSAKVALRNLWRAVRLAGDGDA